MNPFSIAIAGILFVFGLFVGRNTQFSPVLGTTTTQETQTSPTSEQEPDKETPLPTVQEAPTNSPRPTLIPQTSPTTKPQTGENTNISSYVYPGSDTRSTSEQRLTLETNDDADRVIQWYQNIIKQQGFTSISVAKTTTNGTSEHKLASAKNGNKVEVTIKQPERDKKTTIEVILTTSSDNNVKTQINNSKQEKDNE